MSSLLQEARGQTSDFQSWNAIIIDWNFRQSMLLELEVDYNRVLSEGPVWREFAAQPSFEYYPSNNFDLFVGVYMTNTK